MSSGPPKGEKGWDRVEKLYHEALSKPQEQKSQFLESACQGDEGLRHEVESLLDSVEKDGARFEARALDVAARMLANDQASEHRPDLVGRTVAHYRIIKKIGEGGMGEVFLADDTSLDRKVALKFLPPEKQHDTAAHKRFLREAHSAASLDHPFICSIHEVGEYEGRDFIVMEYVDGDTLRDRFTQGPLPLKEVLQIAIEVAEALEAAHSKGIVHRDINPANIMLTRTGHSKVMDFGLAKQLIPSSGIEGQEETITREGWTAGTLAYMSPEQLRGEPVDVRSDIFSFGIVLYEMLAGIHPFKKETGMDTASAILKDAPQALGELRPDAPVLLQHIVKKMLAKDPHDRFPSIPDVRIDLKELLEEPSQQAQEKHRWFKPLYWIAAAALVVIAGSVWAYLLFFPRETALPPARFVPVTTSGGRNPALSPDGNWVAFQWNGERQDNWDIYVKELDGTGFNRLTTDPAPDSSPTWSPDGRQIAFLRRLADRRILYLISPLGGGERKLAEVGGGPLSWSPDGKNIAFVDSKSPGDPTSIWSLSVGTLERKQLTTPDLSSLQGDESPAFSPDGLNLAFVRQRFGRSALYVMQLPDGKPKLVTDRSVPQFICWTTDSREIVFSSQAETAEKALWRVSVDGREPRRVLARGEKVDQPTISRNRLAYVNTTSNSDIWRMELTGKEAMKPPSKPLFAWSSDEVQPVVSPDGNRIAFVSSSSGSREIWVCNSDGTKPVRLTDMKAESVGSPSWSPDGKLVAFDSRKSGNLDIYVVSAEGGPVRRITTDPADEAAAQWSKDGRWIYFFGTLDRGQPIWKIPSEGGKAVQMTKGDGFAAHELADGYLYFNSYRSQTWRVWRVPVSAGQESLVTDAVGRGFLWDPTDRGIYAIDPNVKPAAICFYDFASRKIKSLATVHRDPGFEVQEGMSVSPDGKWLVYDGEISTSDIMMIDNFR